MALALAGVVAFSFAIMIPAVIAAAFLVWYPVVGWRLAAWFTGWLTAATAGVAGVLMTTMHVWPDAIGSTVTRGSGGVAGAGGAGLGTGVAAVVSAAWSWDGLPLALAGAGVVLVFAIERRGSQAPRRGARKFGLFPAYQAHLGTGWSMDKHMSACTWFLAIAAGYAVAAFPWRAWKPAVAAMAAVTLLAYPALTGLWYARSTFQMWPDVSSLVTTVRPLT